MTLAVVTSRVQLTSLQRNSNFVIVAMRIFAFATVIAQVVPRRKTIFNGNFVHDSSGLPSQMCNELKR